MDALRREKNSKIFHCDDHSHKISEICGVSSVVNTKSARDNFQPQAWKTKKKEHPKKMFYSFTKIFFLYFGINDDQVKIKNSPHPRMTAD